MHGRGPLWVPIACLIALAGVLVVLTLLLVPAAHQARALGTLAVGLTMAVLISRALGR